MDNETLTREQRLEIEEKAIGALIDRGAKFSVPLKLEPKDPPRYIKIWNRLFKRKPIVWRDKRIPKGWDVSLEDLPDADLGRIKKVYVRHFHIKPLYLGTIDRLRQLFIQIQYDEAAIDEDPVKASKELFKYAGVMAEIAAVATLNCCDVANPLSKEVVELKQFYLSHLHVKRLRRICLVIDQMMNSGDFASSIRLIKKIGTTQPNPGADLVE